MKNQTTIEKTDPSMKEVIANLLRDKLASRLNDIELESLIKEVTSSIIKEDTTLPHTYEDKMDRLVSIINYMEYKCREIERVSLHMSNRRSHPIGVFREHSMFDNLAMRSNTRRATSFINRPKNPWFDDYFS